MDGYKNSYGGYGSSGYGASGYSGGWGSSGYGGGSSMANMGSVVSNWGGSRGFSNSHAKEVTETDKAIAAGGGAAAAGIALKTAGMAKVVGLAGAVGIGGASSGLVGMAAIAAGGAVGAIAIAHNAPAIGRGISKVSGKFLSKAKNAIVKAHNTYKEKSKTKSGHLEKIDETTKQRAEKFQSFVKDSRDKLVKGEDIKENLKTLHKLKIPTQKSKEKLHNLTADYFVKNNLKDGKLDTKGVNKDLKAFSKEAGLSRNETKDLKAGVQNRVEEHKDNFVMDKDSKVTNLKPNKQAAKESAKDMNKKQENKKEEIKKKQEVKKKEVEKEKTPPPKEKTQDMGKEQGR